MIAQLLLPGEQAFPRENYTECKLKLAIAAILILESLANDVRKLEVRNFQLFMTRA